jgi:hypothetical protein
LIPWVDESRVAGEKLAFAVAVIDDGGSDERTSTMNCTDPEKWLEMGRTSIEGEITGTTSEVELAEIEKMSAVGEITETTRGLDGIEPEKMSFTEEIA